MITPLLHLPLDFDRREDVRRFRRACGGEPMSLLWAVRLWVDWGTAGVEWRPITAAATTDPKQIAWSSEELTYIIEEFCEFTPPDPSAPPGGLIAAALASGVMRLESRGERYGLVLNDFWRFNSHLSPQHRTIQQLGAAAKHAKRHLAEADASAEQQLRLLQAQGQLVFEHKDATPEETKRALAVVMRLDRACGLPTRPSAAYVEEKTLMAAALRVVRGYTAEEINRVCEFIMENRGNPRLVKLPDRILEKFGELLGKTNDGR